MINVSKSIQNFPKLSNSIQNYTELSKTIQNKLKLFKTICSYPILSKSQILQSLTIHFYSKLSKTNQNCSKSNFVPCYPILFMLSNFALINHKKSKFKHFYLRMKSISESYIINNFILSKQIFYYFNTLFFFISFKNNNIF